MCPQAHTEEHRVFFFLSSSVFFLFFFSQWPRDVMEGSMQAVKLTESVINDIAEDEE